MEPSLQFFKSELSGVIFAIFVDSFLNNQPNKLIELL